MKKRRLPIPLILLIPIVLLVIVIVAGLYRFSLSDEEILAKFPQAPAASANLVMEEVFGIKTPNPWTISVPETQAFSFINSIDASRQSAQGNYDSGAERGTVTVSLDKLVSMGSDDMARQYASYLVVSNQGSGAFYYLATFEYDNHRQRMVLKDSAFVGDRVSVSELRYQNGRVELVVLEHGTDQAKSSTPKSQAIYQYDISSRLKIKAL
ncbi:hypothetical protein [Vibrio mexicanus]|uniref:hypothetical protein n=1 Tax=Vibrio mexicanus TaxID=1004326 RepID=UPI00063CADFE|nr:hypothetical protein [Vibrio mexicanus]